MSRIRQILLEFVFSDAFRDLDPQHTVPSQISDGTQQVTIEPDGSVPVTTTNVLADAYQNLDPQFPLPIQIGDGTLQTTLESDGSVPVTGQLRITPIVISPLFLLTDEVTMDAASIGDTSITVSDATNIVDGSHLVITDSTSDVFHIGDVVGAPAGLVVTLDTPLGFNFDALSNVTVGEHNMALSVGTLAAPVIFQARVPTALQSTNAFDTWRIMFSAITSSLGDLSEFGDGPALTNGIVLRKKNADGTFFNIHNAKTNGDLKEMMFDFDLLTAIGQGADGFSGRFSLDKLGGIIRLEQGDDLQLLIQDDMTTRVVTLGLLAEGGVASG